MRPERLGRPLIVLGSATGLLALMLATSRPVRSQEHAGAAAPAAAGPGAGAIGGGDLLGSVPFDRITLSDGAVLIVDPVSPRPLPVIDPAETRKQETVRLKGTNQVVPLEGNIGLPGEPSKLKTKQKEPAEPAEEPAQTVKIHLLQEAEVRDFSVKRSNIKKIEYFEDLLRDEGDRLVQARDFTRAFECFLRVKTRDPSWPGLDASVNKLLFAEGSAALIGGDSDLGLRLLRELLSRNRAFPGLLDQISSAYAAWISRAIELREFSKGRRFLSELQEMAPQHRIPMGLRDRFISLAGKRVKDAEALSGPARLDALVDALRIWPTHEPARALYLKAFEETPTLDVAVEDVPEPLGPWLRSPADARLTRLLYRPILAADTDEARQGKVPGQLASALESSDLGRRLVLRFQPGVAWSDGSRQVGAVDVARALVDRTDPSSPRFQARWAELLDQVASADESRVELRLNRPVLKVGSWLDWPVGPAHAGIDGRIATAQQERVLVSDGPFRLAATSAGAIELLRMQSQGAAPRSGSLARLRELRRGLAGSSLAALLQGDVSLLTHVPPAQMASLRAQSGIKIGTYNQPSIHLIALDARNPILRNRSLRRGLSYAIQRQALLEETVLKRPPDERNAVADGPFPKGSYADAPGVKPLEHHASLAVMLVAAARKELGNAPLELKLAYPAIPEVQAVVPLLAEAFHYSGVRIELVERTESQLESDLRAGGRFDMAYRVLRCEEPVLDAGPLLCPGYDAPPEADALASAASSRILQLLLQLERAVDASTARGLVLQIDREARDELPVLPLWQVADHYAWRDRLKGPGETADRLYDGIETWEITPWIATDPWTKP